MDTAEFLNVSEHETTTAIIARNISNSVVSNKYVDPLFNKYAIIGALLVFTVLLLVSVLYYYLKTDNNSCCKDENLKQLYNVASDDTSSFMDDDDVSSELFGSCQLYVDDQEVNAASGYEYDCRSLDGSSTEAEHTLLISQKQSGYDAFNRPSLCTVHASP